MKRFTALALAVVMTLLAVSSAIPVFAVDVAEANALQTAMNNNEDVTLTGDVDLSTITWKTISEYSGTLDGAGYTITVPADTAFIEKLSGTVKNVNLTGSVVYGDEDVSEYYFTRDLRGYGLGVVANWMWGATVSGVNSDVDVVLNQTKKGIIYGGITGFAIAEFENEAVEYEYKGEVIGTVPGITVNKGAGSVIENCSVGGKVRLDFAKYDRNAIGGIVGVITSACTVSGCAVRSLIWASNTFGQHGGVVGSVRGDMFQYSLDGTNLSKVTVTEPDATDTEATAVYNEQKAALGEKTNEVLNKATEIAGVAKITNCLFDGYIVFDEYKIDQFAAIVGYAIGVEITNCYASGVLTAHGGTARHIISYNNVGGNAYGMVTVDGCASTATVRLNGGKIHQHSYCRNYGYITNNLLMAGQVIASSGASTVLENNNVVGDGSEKALNEKFVELNSNNFKLVDGEVWLARETSVYKNDEVVVIKTAQELLNVKPFGNYVLANDISLAGTNASIPAVAGVTIDGNGKTITLAGKPLFELASHCEVKNLTLAGNVSVVDTTTSVNLGALAAMTSGITVDNLVNNANVSIKYADSLKGTGKHVGGLIGYANYYIEISNVVNNGDVNILQDADKDSNPDVGGIIGQWSLGAGVGSSYLTRVINNGDINYLVENSGNGNVGGLVGRASATGTVAHDDDVLVEQSAFRGTLTANLDGERASGLFGYHRDLTANLCYSTGKLNITPTGKAFGLCGYTNTGSKTASCSGAWTNCYLFLNGSTVTSCISTGNGGGTDIKGNYIPTSGYTKDTASGNWVDKSQQYEESTTYTDAADLLDKLNKDADTKGVFVADECNINYGYPIFAWEAHEYVTLYEDNDKNYVTTGKDLDCDKYNEAEFAGFVQFAEDNSNKVRFVMAIDSDYLVEASAQYESFDIVITVNGDKTATVNSLTLSSYTEVTAGTDVYYADKCEIFGFIMNFGDTVVSSLDFKIVIGEDTFELGSYTAN